MSLIEAYRVLNILCASGVLMAAYLLWFNRKSVKNVDQIIFFAICIFCHLLLTGYLNIGYTPVFWVLIGGACFIPVSCWLLTRSLIGAPKLKKKYLVPLIVSILLCNYALVVWDHYSSPKFPDVLLNIISLAFMGHALFLVFRSSSIRKERNTFLIVAVGIIVVSLMSELALKKHQLIYLFFFQRLCIIWSTAYFLVTTFSLKEGVIIKKSPAVVPQNPDLAGKIADAVTFDKLYLREGLTIAQLSEIVSEKEYKVRHAIIHNLGFKNFTDFINSFRVSEASQMLTEPGNESISILEVAFQVGFSSIGPFNRAFKARTGLTPSQFRESERRVTSNLVVA